MGVWPDTGRVYLVRGVASEEVGSIFTTVITARDGTSPMLSGTADIMIRVVNCTDDNFRYIIYTSALSLTGTDGGATSTSVLSIKLRYDCSIISQHAMQQTSCMKGLSISTY